MKRPRRKRKAKRRPISVEAMLSQSVTLGGEAMVPCPFCGSFKMRAVRVERFTVECVRCLALGPMPAADRMAAAQDAWNARSA